MIQATGSYRAPASAGSSEACADSPARATRIFPGAGDARTSAAWLLLALSVALGTVGLSTALLSLWDIWTNDPLRSIGMLIVLASLVLTLRAWRQCDWELQGTWWGLLPICASLAMSVFRGKIAWIGAVDHFKFDFLAPKVALYCFGSGLVLLFGGTRVWRQAWFPLALLLCAQPVPTLSTRYIDLPLQGFSAQIARSFAVGIGFAPANPEMLRLMFAPDFGMFIARGCDGLRGAVTMGYLALIAGYLKRVSLLRWGSYVVGALLLGYLFNLIRLCGLVIYYRVALGHPFLERGAKQADYAIGGLLILIAAVLFFWVLTRTERNAPADSRPDLKAALGPAGDLSIYRKLAAFAALGVVCILPGVRAIEHHRKSLVLTVRSGEVTRDQLNHLMPRQIGAYRLSRTWQEEDDGELHVESAAYSGPEAKEILLGVWLNPSEHTMHDSWMAHGEWPQMRRDVIFSTANGQPVLFDTAYYSDGATDSLAGNAFCTPSSCLVVYYHKPASYLALIVDPIDFSTRGERAVSIFFRIDVPHGRLSSSGVYDTLSSDARSFLSSVDLRDLSRKYQ